MGPAGALWFSSFSWAGGGVGRWGGGGGGMSCAAPGLALALDDTVYLP